MSHLRICWIFLIFQSAWLGPVSATLFDGETFDFIVVGAGTAGSVVAARLAQAGNTVLLIHEGNFPPAYLSIPGIAFLRVFEDTYSEKYYPTNASQAWGGVLNYQIARVLGGSGSHNEMIANRGSPHDFDNWAELGGDPGWKYENLLEFFRKYENYEGINPTDQRGFHGPITISNPSYAPGTSRWLQGGTELGYKVADPNGPQTESFSWMDFFKRKGRRSSSFIEYVLPMLRTGQASTHNPLTPEFTIPLNFNLEEIHKPGHLSILIETVGKQIIFDQHAYHPKAIGVKFSSATATNLDSVTGQVFARKEVIISAGVMDSPALLMRSGIGPAGLLAKCNIPLVHPLPVGIGIQDHAYIWFPIIYGNGDEILDPGRDLSAESWHAFEQSGEGPYSFSGTTSQATLISSVIPEPERRLGWPDILALPLNRNFANETVPFQWDLRPGEVPVIWAIVVARPRSRGVLTLNCENVEGPPLFDLRLLSDVHDRRVLIDGIKKLVNLCENTKAFQGIGCRLPATPVPSCENEGFRTDAYWDCLIKATVTFGLHAGSSCRMGKGPEGVLDSRLRVKGVIGLRVVDASVKPAITNATPTGAIYAIAEKGADMILEDNGMAGNNATVHYGVAHDVTEN